MNIHGSLRVGSRNGILKGKIEKVTERDGVVIFSGWTANFENKKPADLFAVFHDSELIYIGHNNVRKTHVAKSLGTAPDILYGFQFALPRNVVSKFRKMPMFFAMSRCYGIATPLKYGKAAISEMIDISGVNGKVKKIQFAPDIVVQ